MVSGLLKVIDKAHLVEFYGQLLSYGTIHGVKLPSLGEFLNLTSKESPADSKEFDESTDKLLEAHALKRLNERRAVGK